MNTAFICGPFIGELGWEILRFAPFCLWNKCNKYHTSKMIVFTREDRFDLYGQYADILVPLKINGDFEKYKGNCFRLENFTSDKYVKLQQLINSNFKERFKIIDHIFPNISKSQYVNKDQFPKSRMIHEFVPRKENYELFENNFKSNGKPNIILGPRFRRNYNRNWPYWPQFYDLIFKEGLQKNFNFIICGKHPEYVKDEMNRFFDINSISLNIDSSLIGLTIVAIENSILTVGSQSAIPNLSLSIGIPVLEWGDQEYLHSKVYNYKNTPITFIRDMKYMSSPEIILRTMIKILNTITKKK